MSIVEQIKARHLLARKERDSEKLTSLTTLLGEVTMVGKSKGNRETTDDEAVSVVKKFVANITETCKHYECQDNIQALQKLNELKAERALYEQFLPAQLSEEQILAEVEAIIAGGATNVGAVMAAMKKKHGSSYDGATASRLAKARLG